MTNEIKEILNDMKIVVKDNDDLFRVDLILNKEDTKLLLDYITNLQDKLKWYENIDPNKTIDKFRLEHNMKVKNLHQRIDKAVEYIEEDIKGNYFKRYEDEVYKMCDDLLDILRGDE